MYNTVLIYSLHYMKDSLRASTGKLENLTENDLTEIRDRLSANYPTAEFDQVLRWDNLAIASDVVSVLCILFAFEKAETDQLFTQQENLLATGLERARQTLIPTTPLDPSLYRLTNNSRAKAIVIEAIMDVLKTQIISNQVFNTPTPPPPTLPSFQIPVPIPPAPNPPSQKPISPDGTEFKKIRITPENIAADRRTMERVIAQMKALQATQESFNIRIPFSLSYDYEHPELYTDFYLVRALTLNGPAVDIDPFQENARILETLKSLGRYIKHSQGQ